MSEFPQLVGFTWSGQAGTSTPLEAFLVISVHGFVPQTLLILTENLYPGGLYDWLTMFLELSSRRVLRNSH